MIQKVRSAAIVYTNLRHEVIDNSNSGSVTSCGSECITILRTNTILVTTPVTGIIAFIPILRSAALATEPTGQANPGLSGFIQRNNATEVSSTERALDCRRSIPTCRIVILAFPPDIKNLEIRVGKCKCSKFTIARNITQVYNRGRCRIVVAIVSVDNREREFIIGINSAYHGRKGYNIRQANRDIFIARILEKDLVATIVPDTRFCSKFPSTANILCINVQHQVFRRIVVGT